MHQLTYKRMRHAADPDIPQLLEAYRSPEIAQYLSIGDNYFPYVTSSKDVHYFKVCTEEAFVGAIHLEQQERVLYMSILVFPVHQRKGLGTCILRDILSDHFGLGFDRIEVSIDEENTPSLRLFERSGFIQTGREDELIQYTYQRNTT